MNKLILNQSLDESREMVVEAFKRTEGINKFQQSKYQVVGKTGVSFPRILWSYGESVFVDLSETEDSNKTELEVSAEKEVSMNVGGNAKKFQRRFLNELEYLRDASKENSERTTESPNSTARTERENTTEREETKEVEEQTTSEGAKVLTAFIVSSMLMFFFAMVMAF